MPWSPTYAQSQSLLRIIALAIQQRIPLAPLLRAFAEDQGGGQRWRVHDVAALLEGGSSLPAALEQVTGVLPAENVLAIRFGTQSGTLSITLRNLIEQSGRPVRVRVVQPLISTLLYAACVVLIIINFMTFLMIKIAPAFIRIMEDCGVESPVFQWLVHVADSLASFWWLCLGAGLLLALILLTETPGRALRRRLVRPWYDMGSADVLQNLSVASEAGRPISGALSTLARYHYDPSLRQKLLFVRNEVEHGADLWGTLRRVRLLTPAEVHLMQASEKVGNCAWAMTQLATCQRRRMRRRLELLGQLVHPAAILLLGGIVFTIWLGFFAPVLEILWSLV